MAAPVILLQGVHKHYGIDGVRIHALRGIDLSVHAGEFVAIAGPSGSGKSTLMNVVGCLDLPDSGSYHLNDRDVTRLSEDALARLRNQAVGFIFQSFNLLSRHSALENVETPLIYAGIKRDERRQRARSLLATVGLGDRMNHTPNQLSGGQQQRVAIARALANAPSIILADEPTGNLDSGSGAEVMDILQGLNREKGVTLLMITHEPDIAARAQRRLTLRDGKIER